MFYKNTKEKSGHLYFVGADVTKLAAKYGTPLQILDEEGIKNACKVYIEGVKKNFGKDAFVCYASKALSIVYLKKLLNKEGMCIDAASTGEIYTAFLAGYDMSKVYFHGNYKTKKDIEFAIDKGVGYFMVDNYDELESINSIARQKKVVQKVFLRISPNIKPDTFAQAVTGAKDTKFGVQLEQAVNFVRKASTLSNIKYIGLHSHIGSQIFDVKPFLQASEVMLNLIAKIEKDLVINTTALVLGGGFGVRYLESQPEFDYAKAIEDLARQVKSICKKLGIKMPAIGLEPGRSIVAQNGMTLYEVGCVKEINGASNYVIIDGGMSDNPRYALYEAPYTIYVANRMDEPKNFVATIAGRACESGDLIQKGVKIARPVNGDIIAVLTTGAYNYAMASNYNKMPRPAIVAVAKNTSTKIVVQRETLEDLVKLEIK